MKTLVCYKLFKERKDGSIGPLFINRKQRIPIGVWVSSENHPTKGYAERAGWHCGKEKSAPHLSEKGRSWYKVEVIDWTTYKRPTNQGGEWIIAKHMKVLERCT